MSTLLNLIIIADFHSELHFFHSKLHNDKLHQILTSLLPCRSKSHPALVNPQKERLIRELQKHLLSRKVGMLEYLQSILLQIPLETLLLE